MRKRPQECISQRDRRCSFLPVSFEEFDRPFSKRFVNSSQRMDREGGSANGGKPPFSETDSFDPVPRDGFEQFAVPEHADAGVVDLPVFPSFPVPQPNKKMPEKKRKRNKRQCREQESMKHFPWKTSVFQPEKERHPGKQGPSGGENLGALGFPTGGFRTDFHLGSS
jgi:hypothetical protein